jgi:dolichol kinase
MASLITKRYKKEAFYEFLSARKKTWRQMFAVLICGALLSYPTPILKKIKDMPGITSVQAQ